LFEQYDERTRVHINTIESRWRHVKAFLNPYNWMADYVHQLAHYMFAARCRCENMDQFTKFIDNVANMDWSVSSSHQTAAIAT
jgi:hypothetical protein